MAATTESVLKATGDACNKENVQKVTDEETEKPTEKRMKFQPKYFI